MLWYIKLISFAKATFQLNAQRLQSKIAWLVSNCKQIKQWIIGNGCWLSRKSMINTLHSSPINTSMSSTVNVLLLKASKVKKISSGLDQYLVAAWYCQRQPYWYQYYYWNQRRHHQKNSLRVHTQNNKCISNKNWASAGMVYCLARVHESRRWQTDRITMTTAPSCSSSIMVKPMFSAFISSEHLLISYRNLRL